jgi:DNA-binding NarL/FixJ family response regulator
MKDKNEKITNERINSSKYLIKNNENKNLSDREKEILQEFEKGKSYGETAQSLTISIETVRKHASNIYRKLGVKNKITAVLKHKQNNTFVLFYVNRV